MSLSDTINQLIKLRDEYRSNADHLDATIQILSKSSGVAKAPVNYTQGSFSIQTTTSSRTQSVAQKIKSILLAKGSALTKNEIKELGGFASNIGPSMSTSSDFKSYRDGNNSYWGLSEWFDSEDNVLSHYKYKSSISAA